MLFQRCRQQFFTVFLSTFLVVAALHAEAAATTNNVRTTQQGLHSWNTSSGKLFLVAGTYQDTTSYRRSISFYFQDKSEPSWHQVPIVESAVDYTTAWTTASRGETTLRDAVVIARGTGIYLIIADLDMKKPVIAITRYQFSSAGDDFPDGPGKLFSSHSAATYQLSKVRSIEGALNMEIRNFSGD